jgi:hypothetical protein
MTTLITTALALEQRWRGPVGHGVPWPAWLPYAASMKTFLSRALLLSLGLAALLVADDAEACGGCFIQQAESSQVTGHRMILSLSNDATTLWDQIEYSGAPESFAWVLPIQGQVDVGLSSDALFGQLEAATAVQIFSPSINCQPPPGCFQSSGAFSATNASSSGSGGVTVIAQETVGPYETVQLQSADPQALQLWLESHGFEIPPDVLPVVSDYVTEGFDFLAMKLVPGAAVSSMQPVRVTSMGAGLALPLRMVAAGTGATTPITLWIAGEGRYEPTNFPSFTIDPAQLVWSWDTQSSNYTQLKQLGIDASNGEGWLIEAAQPRSPDSIGGNLLYLAEYDPAASGYSADSSEAIALCTEDLAALYGGLDPQSFWLTRMHAQLPREALSTDLLIGASMTQEEVSPWFYVTTTVGDPPDCPPPPPECDPNGGSGGDGGSDGSGASGGGGSGSGCAVGGPDVRLGAGLAALALAAAWRKRRRGSNRQ